MEIKGLMTPKRRDRKAEEVSLGEQRHLVYLLVFLFTLHLTPAYFINSSFLGQFVSTQNLGYIFTFGSLISFTSFIAVKRLLARFGNFRVFIATLFVTLTAYAVLTTSLFLEPTIALGYTYIFFYIVSFVCHSIALFNLDIFLEHVSKDADTGGIRGIFLTSLNTAFIIGPLIAGFLITNTIDSGKVYALGSLILLPVIFITIKYLRSFKDPIYERSDMWKTSKQVWRNKNLHKVFAANLILRFFYSWMVIYTPIFLHDTIGFTLSQIGFIMGIALIPFVLLEAPLGKIADKYLGEKEILTLGFAITGITTAAMTFLEPTSIAFWTAVLFITRIGASMIEVMTETYLFKKIDDADINILSLYRAVRPIAYVFSPIVASVFLIFFEVRSLFLLLGLIVLFGMRYSLTIKDTR